MVRGDPNFKKNKRRINRFLEETFAKSNEDIFRFAVGRYVGRCKIMGYNGVQILYKSDMMGLLDLCNIYIYNRLI